MFSSPAVQVSTFHSKLKSLLSLYEFDSYNDSYIQDPHIVFWAIQDYSVFLFRHREVLPVEEDCGLSAAQKHLRHGQHGRGSVSHRGDNATQLCWLVTTPPNRSELSV